ncbi:hypothetical protein E5Q_02743 [Mixia osmundae IAM 14324]|uniref:Lysophospholipase n=1 Tax=Mixia osmundae (strain CBS 9802 / IAM 14324 / JCM 22182 / KY 12970) TaxID=764103 RepID=G7DZS2_MIXOS|nr:hypothetical protein E5Q_02743 [Mixia osmundae IAM 14324]
MNILAWLSFVLPIVRAGYAPKTVPCPTAALVRTTGLTPSQSLSTEETAYIQARQSSVLPLLWSQYTEATSTGYASAQFANNWPNLGIAVSGGGLRAAQFAAGALSAFDNRNASAVAAKTAGVLQLASRMSALSGGSWFLTSYLSHDLPSLPALVFGDDKISGWQLDVPLTSPTLQKRSLFTAATHFLDKAGWYRAMFADVASKLAAGFPVSITDLLARALQRFSPNDADRGASDTFSTALKVTSSYSSHRMPYPIIVLNVLKDGQIATNESDPIFEITPSEFASYDNAVSAAIPTRYLGSKMDTTGKPIRCVTGFDNLGFVAASSASLLMENVQSDLKSIPLPSGPLADALRAPQALTARYPNPFRGININTNQEADDEVLSIDDGGMNGEVIPLWPHLMRARNTDVVIALDASTGASSTTFHPTGDSLFAAANRAQLLNDQVSFPPMPSSVDAFVKAGYANRPTFLGCESKFVVKAGDTYPLIVYIPNRPIGTGTTTNYSAFDLQYTLAQQTVFFDSAHEIALSGIPGADGSRDAQWGTPFDALHQTFRRYVH